MGCGLTPRGMAARREDPVERGEEMGLACGKSSPPRHTQTARDLAVSSPTQMRLDQYVRVLERKLNNLSRTAGEMIQNTLCLLNLQVLESIVSMLENLCNGEHTNAQNTDSETSLSGSKQCRVILPCPSSEHRCCFNMTKSSECGVQGAHVPSTHPWGMTGLDKGHRG